MARQATRSDHSELALTERPVERHRSAEGAPGTRRLPVRAGRLIDTVVAGAVPFLAVLCLFAYYGQPHRNRPATRTER